MIDPIISINNIGKIFQLGEFKSYGTLRDTLSDLVYANRAKKRKKFWALKHISFDVARGEVVGIIGRNGAGKSTLLKILSQVSPPTEGSITVRGRVASLLEVGTGFHPELTGRENIYLNGAILGMSRREIKKKFDEIVAFAEIDRFLDTPVKRYSSGMYVRLAFAVAAHLEPEILVVDEVLAVGDTEFQKKCLGKMEDVATKHGRTILFVSHNMGAIRNLCKRVILLERGRIKAIGPTDKVVEQYLKGAIDTHVPLTKRIDRQGNGAVRARTLSITNLQGSEVIKSFDKLIIKVGAKRLKLCKNIELKIAFLDIAGQPLFRVDSGKIAASEIDKPLVFETGEIPLSAMTCYVNIGILADGELADYIQNAYSIDIISSARPGVRNYPNDMAVVLVGNKRK